MNNPSRDTDPSVALFPSPGGCTGHRIWSMLNERTGALRVDYLRVFDRRNLLSERNWCPTRAGRESRGLWKSLKGRTVIVLGHAARQVLWLPQESELLWRKDGGVKWCFMPHPSGLNHWYNDTINREAAALRLETLYAQQGMET